MSLLKPPMPTKEKNGLSCSPHGPLFGDQVRLSCGDFDYRKTVEMYSVT